MKKYLIVICIIQIFGFAFLQAQNCDSVRGIYYAKIVNGNIDEGNNFDNVSFFSIETDKSKDVFSKNEFIKHLNISPIPNNEEALKDIEKVVITPEQGETITENDKVTIDKEEFIKMLNNAENIQVNDNNEYVVSIKDNTLTIANIDDLGFKIKYLIKEIKKSGDNFVFITTLNEEFVLEMNGNKLLLSKTKSLGKGNKFKMELSR